MGISISRIRKITEPEFGSSLHLTDGKSIRRRGLADACRSLVNSRRGIPEATLVHWAVELLQASGMELEYSRNEAQAVVSALVIMGDIGKAQVFERTMIVSIRSTRIGLPDGRFVLLGNDEGQAVTPPGNDELTRTVFASPDGQSKTLAELLGKPYFRRCSHGFQGHIDFSHLTRHIGKMTDVSDELKLWADFSAGRSSILAKDQVKRTDRLPEQLARALLLCGECRPDENSWSINSECTRFINDWLGIRTDPPSWSIATVVPDAEQKKAIEALVSARLIVKAGPGSGKTMVACERVAHLIEEGAAPPRIWLLSFTRVAVEEIKKRIGDILDDHALAFAVNVATFDSLSGRLNAAFKSDASEIFTSYDASINQAIKLLHSDDMAVSDYISGFEHVIIDEAQDLVGARKSLVIALLEQLEDSCGVTVFTDFAQAIYGFQEQECEENTASLAENLQTQKTNPWSSQRLVTDHRTRNDRLAAMFRNAREILRDATLEPEQKYDAVREEIEKGATRTISRSWENESGLFGNSLVLFRNRSSVFSAVEKLRDRQIPFRVRMSNHSAFMIPWPGAVLSGQGRDEIIGQKDFDILWQDVWPTPARIDQQTAWKKLCHLATHTSSGIHVGKLCEQLERHKPLDLITDHIGSTGPLISTIHAAKGREAERVLLLLPPKPREDKRPVDWEEEARILYVGASRARSELILGPARGWLKRERESGRFRRGSTIEGGNPLQVEIGLEGDILDHQAFLETANLGEKRREHASTLWGMNHIFARAFALRTAPGKPYLVHSENDADSLSMPMAALSDSLINDLARISRTQVNELPDRLYGFYIAAIRTVIVSGGNQNSLKPSEIGLAPLLGGLVTIRF